MPWRNARIELHGWDAHEHAWHGPDELTFSLDGCRRILQRMREVPGSWYGTARCQEPGEVPVEFCLSAHDLHDAGLAVVDIEASPGGPLHFVVVVPAQRRARVRPDFAFECVSFLRFLEGQPSQGSELAIHDHLHALLDRRSTGGTLVFSIGSHAAPPEAHRLILLQAERLAMSMIAWLGERDEKPSRCRTGALPHSTT